MTWSLQKALSLFPTWLCHCKCSIRNNSDTTAEHLALCLKLRPTKRCMSPYRSNPYTSIHWKKYIYIYTDIHWKKKCREWKYRRIKQFWRSRTSIAEYSCYYPSKCQAILLFFSEMFSNTEGSFMPYFNHHMASYS